MTLIAPTLQAFFTDRLGRQRQASPRTIAAYRDTMRLLLTFVQQHGGKPPSTLDWDDLTADVISAFLNHLEDERGNSARTRNVRLTAIRSLFSFAALQHPEHALLIARVLDIPPKRFDKRTVTFLPPMKATRCWRHRIRDAGKAGATRPCWPWPSRPACVSPKSQA
jgi:site-specific recombinase XerD